MSNERTARVQPARPDRAGGTGVRRPPRLRCPGPVARVALAIAALLAAGWSSTSQARTLDATLGSRLLSVADLPVGWSVAPASPKSAQMTTSACGAVLLAVVSPQSLPQSPLGPTYDRASFVQGAEIPVLYEVLASGGQAQDVLGWSMGTTVAQALAVLHPSEVRRLVLCAPYPGNGAVVLPPKAVLDAKNDPTALFPADQAGAEATYYTAILSYPKAPPAPTATDSAQSQALDQWWAGADPAGHLVAKIAALTLLADGTVDRLDPVANSHLLARLIHGATLTLYPDAGHAFLFQDYSAFAALVESFLGQGKSS